MYNLNFSTFYSEVSDYGHQCGFGTRLWIDDIDFLKTTDIQDISSNSLLNIYPNPTKNSFSLDTKEHIKSVSFIDVNGKTFLIPFEDGKKIDCSSLTKGIYVVKFETEKDIFGRKLVIE